MYKLKLGWTKDRVRTQIKKYNNGNRALRHCTNYCTYKDNGGNRCFIGAFIPDDHTEAFDSWDSVSHLLDKYPELDDEMPFRDVEVLKAFQAAHDDAVQSTLQALEQFLELCEETKLP